MRPVPDRGIVNRIAQRSHRLDDVAPEQVGMRLLRAQAAFRPGACFRSGSRFLICFFQELTSLGAEVYSPWKLLCFPSKKRLRITAARSRVAAGPKVEPSKRV